MSSKNKEILGCLNDLKFVRCTLLIEALNNFAVNIVLLNTLTNLKQMLCMTSRSFSGIADMDRLQRAK